MAENNSEQIIKHLDSIIAMAASLKNEDTASAYGIIARAKNAIEKIAGKESAYYDQMEEILEFATLTDYKARLIAGVIKGLKGEVADGSLSSMAEVIHARVFNNFLEMAEYLNGEGYKDAAAVIAGSTLEAHLRQLAIKNGISIESSNTGSKSKPKSASQLNQELGQKVYKLFDQKMVTAWLDIRNNAAHGKYEEYSQSQVDSMIEGIRDFIERNPA